jgi:hypothetical protein
MIKRKDISLVYNHATNRAEQRFGLKLNNDALKELNRMALNSKVLGWQIYEHIPKRSLRAIYPYHSEATRKLNSDLKENDCILAVCGMTYDKCGSKKLRIITFLPETEVEDEVFHSTYNNQNMKW